MNKPSLYFLLLALLTHAMLLHADTLIFSNQSTVSGTIIQTNKDSVLLLADNSAFVFPNSGIKETKFDSSQNLELDGVGALPSFVKSLVHLSRQTWATNLTPIPATVIDKGVLKNVPYSSFRCGDDYEFNVYGELEHPAGIEIGIYRKLTDSPAIKNNCIKFIAELLGTDSDKEFLSKLNLKSDYKTHGDLSFEITPTTDLDSYGGWWVSVYSEHELNLARATDDEMKNISMTKTDATNSPSAWTENDLKLARASRPTTISFTSPSGYAVSNAEVVRVVDGVNLFWRVDPAHAGMVKLADLPEKLRNQFGYNADKSEAAEALNKKQKAEWHQQFLATDVTSLFRAG